jgi:multiple sugar transport system substrate-binding protein
MLRKCLVGILIVLFLSSLEGLAFAQEVVTLRVAHAWEPTFIDVQKKFDEEFMKRHPNIKIQLENYSWDNILEKYQTQAATKTLPDVFYIHCSWGQNFIKSGMLMNLQPLIDKDPAFNMKDFFPVAFTPFKDKGNIYVIPYDCGSVILFYNVDMFKSAGLAFPNKNWRLDKEYFETALKLTKKDDKGNIIQFGIDRGPSLDYEVIIPALKSFGGRFMNDEETQLYLTEPKTIAAAQWWTDLITKYHVSPTPAESQGLVEPFTFGKVGMTFGGSWMLERWVRFGKFKADVQEWPSGPAGRFTSAAGSGYGISAYTKYPKEAWTYLREYLSKDGEVFMWGKTGRGSPTRRSAWPSFEDAWKGLNVKAFRNAMNYAEYVHPISPVAAQLNQIRDREIQLILLGKKTVAEAFKTIEEESLPIMAKASK